MFIRYHFFLYRTTFFSISYGADVLVTNFCIFLLFKKFYYFFILVKIMSTGYRILYCPYFGVKCVKMLICCLLIFIFSDEKSEIFQIVVPLYVRCHSSFSVLKIFSLLLVFKMVLFILIPLWVY